jgi:prephenate dehydrogenase
VAAARAAGLSRFVGGHPMAGGATSGPSGAKEDLFDGRSWFIVPHGADALALERVVAFVRDLRAIPIQMTDDGTEHDRAMAAISHVPQVVASALMVVVADAARDRLSWAGSGLRDTTRLATSSARMWQSILSTNADEIVPLLRAMATHLERVADQLAEGQDVSALFVEANRARELL